MTRSNPCRESSHSHLSDLTACSPLSGCQNPFASQTPGDGMVTTRSRAAEIHASPRKKAIAVEIRAAPSKEAIPAEIHVSLSKEAYPIAPPTPAGKDDTYERSRNERIRENLERMQKLGIFSLSHKLKSEYLAAAMRRGPKSPPARKVTPLSKDLPSRRSSRLQDVAPVRYSEGEKTTGMDSTGKKKRRRESVELVCKDEVYTEEHDKLLGTCESAWTLFVDGYGANGSRIYDPVNGKTCHQCRQKTLGHRTSCSKCEMLQGQFCGDCLYLRYGENVLEAKQNPDWICPVCRGICNCSLCRLKKGWAPTGALARRVIGLGFKSVAHYLIQTRRLQTKLETQESVEPVSAKKSLFVNVEDCSSSCSGEKTQMVSDNKYNADNMLQVPHVNQNAEDKTQVADDDHSVENNIHVLNDNQCSKISLQVSSDVHSPQQKNEFFVNSEESMSHVSFDNSFSSLTKLECGTKLMSHDSNDNHGVFKVDVSADDTLGNDSLKIEGKHRQVNGTKSATPVVTSSVITRSRKKRMFDQMESGKKAVYHDFCSMTESRHVSNLDSKVKTRSMCNRQVHVQILA